MRKTFLIVIFFDSKKSDNLLDQNCVGVDVGSHKIDSASSPSVIALCFKCCKTLIGAWKYVISQFFILSPVLLKPGGGEARTKTGSSFVSKLCVHVGSHYS